LVVPSRPVRDARRGPHGAPGERFGVQRRPPPIRKCEKAAAKRILPNRPNSISEELQRARTPGQSAAPPRLGAPQTARPIAIPSPRAYERGDENKVSKIRC